MPNIKIAISEKRATLVGCPVIICGNSDYTVTFTFDEEWDGLDAKTARFVYVKEGEVKHEDVVFTGDTVAVPVLSDVLFVKVGVFAGDLSTTTPARILCDASILCGSGAPQAPTQDVYNQIMALLDEVGRLEQVPQIEQNRRDVIALQQKDGEHDTSIQNLAEALSETNTDLGELGETVGTLAADVDGLKQKTENLQPDSYIQKESLAQTLDDEETDNAPSVAAVKVALANFSGGDTATVKYVSDLNDENYDWQMVLDAEGNWVRDRKVGLKVGTLFRPYSNNAEFVATTEYGTYYYPKEATVTVSDVLALTPTYTGEAAASGYHMMSKKIDVTNFSKIYMKHKTTLPKVSEYDWAKIYVVSDLKGKVTDTVVLTPLAENIYLKNTVQVLEDTTVLDISFVSGEVYIFVELRPNTAGHNSSNCSCIIEEMWME